MNLLRNPEIRKELLIGLAVTAICAVGSFFIHPLAALIVLLCGLALCGLHLYDTSLRYRRIAALSREIDGILHGEYPLLIEQTGEGELSILYHELHNMTVRLKEQSDLLAADKIRLTDAIADIFHQIRTPLTSIHLGIAMLKDPDLPYEQRLALTHELSGQAERIRWLVETLLKLSKLDAGTAVFAPVPITADDLLQKAAAPFSIPMELRDQTLLLETHGEPVVCDPAWTVEALGNLLKNAMEHTPAGGTISVTASETPLYTELVFTDTGEGFDSGDLPHLFERYYRGKNAAPDSIGIGLALTRQVLAMQNATVAAANRPTGGAKFTVRFYKTVI